MHLAQRVKHLVLMTLWVGCVRPSICLFSKLEKRLMFDE